MRSWRSRGGKRSEQCTARSEASWARSHSQDQVQSAYPLDEAGSLVLVGRLCTTGEDSEEYRVYDLSSGEAVRVAGIDATNFGFVTAAHSPPGREIGFGGRNNVFFIYDGGFQAIPMPCSPDDCFISDVWAATPTDVWIVTGPAYPGFPPLGIIWYWDGESFTVEYEGGAFWSLWGFGGPHPAAVYAVGDRIMKRDPHGTWHEMMGADEVLSACGPFGLWDVHGQNPVDVWTVGFFPCFFHYDGNGWSEMPLPDNGVLFGGLWSLSARQILLAGQGGRRFGGRHDRALGQPRWRVYVATVPRSGLHRPAHRIGRGIFRFRRYARRTLALRPQHRWNVGARRRGERSIGFVGFDRGELGANVVQRSF